MLLLAAGCTLSVMLLTAWRLAPEPSGMGTHQQLGLAPCTVVQWFGLRCPSCGMTTAWANLVRGRVIAALQANAGGSLLALGAALAAPWFLVSGLAGRWVVARPSEIWFFGLAVLTLAITLVQWGVRISLGW